MKALESIVKSIEFEFRNSGLINKSMLNEKIRDFIPTIAQTNFSLRDVNESETEITIPYDDVTLVGRIVWRKGEWHQFVLSTSNLVAIKET